jgi:NAD(P)-dependent dehydrogenase (short-subunit alcohol dehydrogenase family)
MHVLLAGGAGGIGRRLARQLAPDHEVTALDRDESALSELPAAVTTHRVDLTDEQAVRQLLDGVEADVFVSAVGWYELAAIEDCPPDALRAHLEANLLAVHTPIHVVLPTLRRRQGRIVVVGSMVGSVPLPYHGAYSAAKAGRAGYLDSLRREVGPRGVSVSLIEPGPVRTGFNERAAEALARIDDSAYAEQYHAFESYSPTATDPETVVETVLAAVHADSPRARYRVSARARWLPRLATFLPTPLFDRLIRSGLPGGLLHRLIER